MHKRLVAQEVVAPSIWKLNTINMFLSFRLDHGAKIAPIWRSRLHIGGARPNERVQTYSSPNKTPSNMVRKAAFCSMRCGIVAALRLQIDDCVQSITR